MPDTRKRDTSKTRPAIFLGRSAAGKNRVHPVKIHCFFCNNFAVCSFCAKTGLDAEKGVTLHPGGFARPLQK